MPHRNRHFNDFTTYAVPYFRPGPALEDWQGPAAFPQVQMPVVEEISMPDRLLMPNFPDVGNPYIRHYVEPSWNDYVGRGSLATSGRSKDVRGSMSRRSQLPVEEQAMVPRFRHVFRSEAPSDSALSDLDADIASLLGEVDDELGYDDDFGVDDDLDTFLERLGAEKGKPGLKKPFEAVSKLFRKNPETGKTRAEEALATVRQIELSRQLPPPPPPPPQGLTATQVAMGVGGAVALLGLGFLAAQAWSSRG